MKRKFEYCKLLILVGSFITLPACEKVFPPSPYACESQPSQYKNIEEQKVSLIVLWAEKNKELLNEKNTLIQIVGEKTNHPYRIWFRENTIKNFTFSDIEREGKVISAVVSANETNPDTLIELKQHLIPYSDQIAIYAAQKSIPLSYTQNWNNGEQTPALISMSFFQKPETMNKREFKNYWFCAHTPFAIDIHPLWHYERNAIEQVLTENAPAYDGIVPLYIENDEDISFSKFFGADGGNPLVNALRIQSDVKNFINLDLIETVAMREYVINAKVFEASEVVRDPQ